MKDQEPREVPYWLQLLIYMITAALAGAARAHWAADHFGWCQ